MLHCFGCGKDLPDNLAYCLYCGAKLEDEEETVVNPTPVPPTVVYEPVPQETRDSGIGKFILGSVLGGLLVVVLLVLGGLVLFSIKNNDNTIKGPVMNANTETPTPARSPSPTPSPRKSSPSPTPSEVNNNGNTKSSERECKIVNPVGGTVNLRKYCDTRDCSMDTSTLYTQADPGETVVPTGRSSVTTGRFTWVQVRYQGEVLWISSTRMSCN